MVTTRRDYHIRCIGHSIELTCHWFYTASLSGQGAAMQKREILYLLAVGQYRAGEYARSRRLVDQALLVSKSLLPCSYVVQNHTCTLNGINIIFICALFSDNLLCLQIAPDFRQAAALKTMVEDKIAKGKF